MAKKYEFKPDKRSGGLWQKLYLTKKQRRSILRWALYALTLLVLSVLQDVILCRFRLFGATTDLIPPAIFVICLIEGAHNSCIFALVASMLYLFSGTAPGYYSMVLIPVLAIAASLAQQAFLQKGLGATFLCASVALVLYEALTFLMGLFLEVTLPGRFLGFMTTTALSLPFILILYPICTSIETLGGETWKE